MIIDNLSNEDYHRGEDYRRYISSTQLKHYAVSPAYARRKMAEPDEQTPAQAFGTLVHATMEHIARHGSLDDFADCVAVFCAPINAKTGAAYTPASKAYTDAYGAFLAANAGKLIASTDDLVNALKNVAQSGLTLNPVLKLGYLVPFKGKILFMASYMGQVSVLARMGLVCKVEAHPVFEGDEFVITYGTAEQLIHKPNPWGTRDKDHLKGCYYYMELANGKAMWDTMSVAEIEDVRRRSPSVTKGKSSPWDTDYIEMAKKTLIRRAFKVAFKHAADNGAESESKRKAITAAVDYDEQVEREWIRRKDAENAQKRGFYGDATTQADNTPFVDVEPIVD